MNTPPARLVIVVVLSILGGPACVPQARVNIHQPRAEGLQQNLRLRSDRAYFTEKNGTRVLLAFPLPGARRGAKRYFIYMRCPSAGGQYALGPDGADDVRGFFQQVRGRHAGVSPFVKAAISLTSDADSCSGRFELECEDGTQLEGDFVARCGAGEVRQFEESFGLD